MARFNKVKIGSDTWLTSNGASDGAPCKVTVTGINFLKNTKTGSIKSSADGTPYVQLLDNGHKGVSIEIKVDFLIKSIFDTIVSKHNDSKNNQTVIALQILGDTGNFSFNAIPSVPNDIDFDGFTGGIIKSSVFRYVIT